jgi:predicted hydrocarbon binding protein
MEDTAKQLVSMVSMMTRMQGALCKAFYQKYGKEALPIVNGVMSQAGVQWGKMMQQTLPVKSMKSIAEQLKVMGAMMAMGTEIVDVSDDMVHFKVSNCPFGIEGTSRELCEAAMAADEKRLSTFFGKGIDMKILETVAAGDKQCDIVFSKK